MSIGDAIRKLSATDDEVYSIIGEVKDIDQSARTCTVVPINGDAEIFSVRLQSVISNEKGFTAYPKAGSQVVVTFLNKQTGYIALMSDIEKVEVKINLQELTYSADGLHVASSTSDLKSELNAICDLFDGLLTTLQTFQVLTPAGPSTNVMPQVITDLLAKQVQIAQIKTKINTFLV